MGQATLPSLGSGGLQTPVVVQQVPQRRSLLGTLLQGLVALLLLGLLGAMVVVLLALTSLVGLPGKAADGLTGRVGNLATDAGRAVTDAGRALRDATDAAREPVGLTYDTEFTSLRVVRVGDSLGDARDYTVTVAEVRRRDQATSPNTAAYASIHVELRQPRETRVLGQVIRTDKDAHDYVLYKGESFRIGRTVYRVNWVSREDGSIAVAAYRRPDDLLGPLKFEYD